MLTAAVPATAPPLRFTAVIVRPRYRADDGRFAVWCVRVVERLTPATESALPLAETTIVGALCDLKVNQLVEVEGQVERHPQYGTQVRVLSCLRSQGNSDEGTLAYLATLPNIGPARARRLVKELGVDGALKALDHDVDRVASTLGLRDSALLAKAAQVHAESRHERDARILLGKCGLGPHLQAAAIKHFGAAQVPVVLDQDPYQLIDVRGIGWTIADAAAKRLGIEDTDPRRTTAACGVLVTSMLNEGHCCARREQLAGLQGGEEAKLVARLNLAPADVLDALSRSPLAEVDAEDERVYFAKALQAERLIADAIGRLMQAKDKIPKVPINTSVLKGLHQSQVDALRIACEHPVSVVTGGPGCGKTMLVSRVLDAMERKCGPIALCAPTGAAAKRMREETGRPASTIHRLLEWSPAERRFLRNEGNPIDAKLVIADEESMTDVYLAACLFRAIPPAARVILVGDIYQLPSVGPGSVLKDIIESGVAPTTYLTYVFRQAEGSAIKLAAQDINAGRVPDLNGHGDFLFLPIDDHGQIQEAVVEAAARGIQRDRGIDPSRVQVIAPMKKGLIGTMGLNTAMQAALNPIHDGGIPPVDIGLDARAHAGDRIVQRKNNYALGVMNGEVGYMLGHDPKGLPIVIGEDGVMRLHDAPIAVGFGVRVGVDGVETDARATDDNDNRRVITATDFDGTIVGHRRHEAKDLQLAYATTVHSAQGAAFDAVIAIMHRSHYRMLHRCLFYTAVSRARRLCIVIGQAGAVRLAVSTNASVERRTGLARRIAQACGK